MDCRSESRLLFPTSSKQGVEYYVLVCIVHMITTGYGEVFVCVSDM